MSVDVEEPDEEEVRAALNDLYGEAKGVKDNSRKRKRRKTLDHERKGKKGRSPVIDYVRSLGDYKVASEVADELGVSVAFIRKLAKNRVTQAPSKVAPFGDTHVHLFTDDDVEALRVYLKEQRKVYDYDDYPFKDKES